MIRPPRNAQNKTDTLLTGTILTLLLCCLFAAASAEIKLPALVSDSMVIQRDAKVKIWGWADKGEKISVTFNKKTYRASAGQDGKWFVWLSPTRAGGPYEMKIKGTETISLTNILAGDVWLCSGQSNMVHYLELHKERYAKEIEAANYPQIRQFLVPTNTNLLEPEDDLAGGRWKTATDGNIMKFSVVAYFFAKKLYDKYKIPIGLINASVGGTPIEAWMSEDALKEFPDILGTIQKNKDTASVNAINRAAAEHAKKIAAARSQDEGMASSPQWYDPSYVPKGWGTINIPGYWEDQGVKDLDGVIWYRREIVIPESMASQPAKVSLGRIVDADHLYVNGKQVGNTTYQYPQRRYTIPAGLLKPGKNLLVIRVRNNFGKGGFVPDKPYHLAVEDDTLDLKGYWQFKVGSVFERDDNPVRGISIQNQPTSLYNGMIAPVTQFPIKGVIWYQGESNADRPEEYGRLLPAIIADWRKQWNQDELPFLYVQLPNFMDVTYSPSESKWAEMREGQLNTLTVPQTAMAVTIDLGEWNDIHPGNKKPIGDRLALAAQKIAYDEKDIVHSGPIVKSAESNGNKVIISFDHVGGGLVAVDGEPLNRFALAGEDKKFVWATATIDGDDVVVWNEEIPDPRYVRYAWADNPAGANLYNKEGLPASPFRIDVSQLTESANPSN